MKIVGHWFSYTNSFLQTQYFRHKETFVFNNFPKFPNILWWVTVWYLIKQNCWIQFKSICIQNRGGGWVMRGVLTKWRLQLLATLITIQTSLKPQGISCYIGSHQPHPCLVTIPILYWSPTLFYILLSPNSWRFGCKFEHPARSDPHTVAKLWKLHGEEVGITKLWWPWHPGRAGG